MRGKGNSGARDGHGTGHPRGRGRGGHKGGRFDLSRGASNANIGLLETDPEEIIEETPSEDDTNENSGYVSFDMDVEMNKCTRNKRKVDEGYSPSTSINSNKRNSKNKSTSNDNHNKESTDDSDRLSDNVKQRYKKKVKQMDNQQKHKLDY